MCKRREGTYSKLNINIFIHVEKIEQKNYDNLLNAAIW